MQHPHTEGASIEHGAITRHSQGKSLASFTCPRPTVRALQHTSDRAAVNQEVDTEEEVIGALHAEWARKAGVPKKEGTITRGVELQDKN